MKKIEVSASVTEKFMAKATEVWVADGKPTTYGQDHNAMALQRALREVDPGFGPKAVDPSYRYSPEQWTVILMLLKRGSNANAINNALHSTKTEAPSVLATEYATMT